MAKNGREKETISVSLPTELLKKIEEMRKIKVDESSYLEERSKVIEKLLVIGINNKPSNVDLNVVVDSAFDMDRKGINVKNLDFNFAQKLGLLKKKD